MRTYDHTVRRLSKSSRVRHIRAKMLFLTKATAALVAQCPGSSALTCDAIVVKKLLLTSTSGTLPVSRQVFCDEFSVE